MLLTAAFGDLAVRLLSGIPKLIDAADLRRSTILRLSRSGGLDQSVHSKQPLRSMNRRKIQSDLRTKSRSRPCCGDFAP